MIAASRYCGIDHGHSCNPEMKPMRRRDLVFFLGWYDLEMATVAELLHECGSPFYDRGLSWGNAVASAYRAEIQATFTRHMTPVLVELRMEVKG